MSDPTVRMIRSILGMPVDDDAYEPDDLAYDLGDYKNPGWVDDVEDRAEQWAEDQR